VDEETRPQVEFLRQTDGMDMSPDKIRDIAATTDLILTVYRSAEEAGVEDGLVVYYPRHWLNRFKKDHALARNWVQFLRMHADLLDKKFPVQ
jgi:hypothetical protein